MPKFNRDRIRRWLEEHNWTVQRFTRECNALGDDVFAEGTVRNAVNGINPMRPRRIRIIARVTARYGDGIPYAHLIDGPHNRIEMSPTYHRRYEPQG